MIDREFWDDFILESTEDEIGLWEVVSEVRHTTQESDEQIIRMKVIENIRDILLSGFMSIGIFECVDNSSKELEFRVWKTSIEESLNRIEREWDDLGKAPSIGDIAWLVITSKGELEAKRIRGENS